MKNLERLAACAGRWSGKSTVQDPHGGIFDESQSTMTVTPVLGGRFVRIDYTWAFRGTPQEGSILVGLDASGGEATAHWIDSWHMSDKVMACRGTIGLKGEIGVRGAYAAPPGPDWGWRIDLSPEEKTLRLVMHNVTPEGQEEIAVEAEYARAGA